MVQASVPQMSADDQLLVTQGVVRGRNALVGTSVPGLRLQLRVTLAGLDRDEVEFVPMTPAAAPAGGWPRGVYEAPLPAGLVVKAVPGTGAGEGFTPLALGEQYHLTKLLPRGQTALGTHLFHRRSRISDTPTLCFMLAQVLDSPEHDPVEKFEAVKILSYRALESLDPAQISSVFGLVDRGLELADQLRYEFSVASGAKFQESRHQARVSLRQARWYAGILSRNWEKARADIEWLLEQAPLARQCPTVAYNSAMTVLTLGQVRRMAGDKEGAVAAFNAAIEFFRSAAALMPANVPGAFREIGVSFEAAKAATCVLHIMKGKGGKDLEDLSWPRLAQEFSRFRTAESREAYAAALPGFVEFLAASKAGS